jgi:group I intron endonuclease
MIVYKITNLINGKSYIGQTIRKLEYRWAAHCSKHYNTYISKSIRKYGETSFTFEEIGGANNITELNYQEFILIHKHNTLYPNGYNMQEGGRNGKASMKTRLRMKRAQRIIHSDPVKGREVRKKQSDARMGFKEPESMLAKKWKKTICHQNGKIYKSQIEAGKELGLFPNMISAICLGKRQHTKGYSFEFYEDGVEYEIQELRYIPGDKKMAEKLIKKGVLSCDKIAELTNFSRATIFALKKKIN